MSSASTDTVQEALTVLRQARREGMSLGTLSKRARLGHSTLKQFFSRRYRGNNQRVAERVIAEVVPLLKRWPLKPIKPRPQQLKQLHPNLHAAIKHHARRFGEEGVYRDFGIESARIWPLIRGTDKRGAADVVARFESLTANAVASGSRVLLSVAAVNRSNELPENDSAAA